MDQEDWVERQEQDAEKQKKAAINAGANADQTGKFLVVRAEEGGDYKWWEFAIPMQYRANPMESRNGCLDTEIIGALIERQEQFLLGSMACEESKQALFHMQAAKRCLEERVSRRKTQGIYATMKETDPPKA